MVVLFHYRLQQCSEEKKCQKASLVSYLESKKMLFVPKPKHELWPLVRIGKELGDSVPQPPEGAVPRVPAEDGQGEVEL